MERTNGYVVGHKTVRGVSTWSVKIQDDSHPLNGQKLNVVGNAPNLRPALDVDFLVLEQNGLSIAADVSPRGVVSAQLEGTKQMVKNSVRKYAAYVIGAIFALTISGTLLAMYVRFNSQEVKEQFVEFKVATTLKHLKTMSFTDMVTEQVIRQTIRGGVSTYAARAAVFDAHLCPTFGSKYWDKNSKCFDVLYASNSGRPKVYLEGTGVPETVISPINTFRATATAKAREYLSDPKRLEEFYIRWESVIVDELRKASPDLRRQILGDINAFEAYLLKPEVKQAYEAHKKALDEMLSDTKRNSTPYEKETTPYQRYDIAWKEFNDLVPGYTRTIAFAARREAEGGVVAVVRLSRIGNSIRHHLEQMK